METYLNHTLINKSLTNCMFVRLWCRFIIWNRNSIFFNQKILKCGIAKLFHLFFIFVRLWCRFIIWNRDSNFCYQIDTARHLKNINAIFKLLHSIFFPSIHSSVHYKLYRVSLRFLEKCTTEKTGLTSHINTTTTLWLST